MDESQPTRTERTDAGSRVIVARLDTVLSRMEALSKRVEEAEEKVTVMETRQEGNVTFRGVLVGAASLLALFLGAFYTVVTRAESLSKEAGAAALEVAQKSEDRQAKLETFVKIELQDFKREIKADLAEVKAEVRNTTRAVDRVKKEVVDAR